MSRIGTETNDSANGPNEYGITRGALYRIVEQVTWYRQRAMAKARLPGKNSAHVYLLSCGLNIMMGMKARYVPGRLKQSSAAAHVPATNAAYNWKTT